MIAHAFGPSTNGKKLLFFECRVDRYLAIERVYADPKQVRAAANSTILDIFLFEALRFIDHGFDPFAAHGANVDTDHNVYGKHKARRN
jgi:hypothetical protein